MVKLSIITNTLLFLALPLLKSSILLKWLNHHRLRFAVLLWVNGLAGEGVRVHQLLAGLAVNQSRLASDTGNDRGLVVVVPGIRPVPVALVLLGTLEVEQVFRAAAQLIRPIAALDAFIVEETSRLTLSSTGHTPGALAVENVARFAVLFSKKTELIGATGRADGLGSNLILGTGNIPVVGAETDYMTSLGGEEQPIWAVLVRQSAVRTLEVLITGLRVGIPKDALMWTAQWDLLTGLQSQRCRGVDQSTQST